MSFDLVLISLQQKLHELHAKPEQTLSGIGLANPMVSFVATHKRGTKTMLSRPWGYFLGNPVPSGLSGRELGSVILK